MKKNKMFKKMVSLAVVLCITSSVQFSQPRAMQQPEEPSCWASGNPAIDELAKRLVGLDACHNGVCINEVDLKKINETAYDWPGLIVAYHLLMFIYYGGICLETLDPSACGSMVNHLVIAIVLGTILEGF